MEVTYVNQDKIKTNGIDFMLSYRLSLGAKGGELNAGIGGTYTISYMIPATAVPELNVTNPDAGMGQPPTTRVAQDGCDGAERGECNVVGTEPWPGVYPPEEDIDRPKGGMDAGSEDVGTDASSAGDAALDAAADGATSDAGANGDAAADAGPSGDATSDAAPGSDGADSAAGAAADASQEAG